MNSESLKSVDRNYYRIVTFLLRGGYEKSWSVVDITQWLQGQLEVQIQILISLITLERCFNSSHWTFIDSIVEGGTD